MGTLFSCFSDDDGLDDHERARLDVVLTGAKFTRKKLAALGIALSTERVVVRLTEDQSAVVWRTAESRGSLGHGSVKVTSIDSVKPSGDTGLVLVGGEGEGDGREKEDLQLEADDVATRDKWVVALTEVVERSIASGKHNKVQREVKAAQEAEKKRAYWSRRRQDLKDGEKAAAEKKKKYSSQGMKYTAQALANRS